MRFGAFISLMSERYPHATARTLPWPQFQAELLDRAAAAAQKRDLPAYAQVFADIGQRLRDGQFQVTLPDGVRLYPGSGLPDLGLTSQTQQRGGATVPLPRVWLLDNGRGMVSDVAPGSAAAQAGLRPGAEILDIAGEPLRRHLERSATRLACTTDSSCALSALTLSSSTEASLSIKVSQDGAEQTLQLRRPGSDTAAAPPTTAADTASAFQLRSVSGKNYGYMVVSSFAQADTNLELWERSLASANRAGLPGLILDLRGNHGESTQLVAHFVASFFSYDKPLRLQGDTQRHFDSATRVWRARGGFGLPPLLPLHASGDAYYPGQLILLTGRDCGGACQLFSAWLQRTQRAQVMAAEPSAGGGIGHTMRVSLPDGIVVRVPVVAEISPSGQSYAQGSGINPDLRIPLDLEFMGKVMRAEDPVLDAAVLQLDQVFSKR
ncbi:MAG: hypothetical protein IPF55_03495 [Rhodoferax sp.]|nr:hypothetical protein [Rhodoferax sp.]